MTTEAPIKALRCRGCKKLLAEVVSVPFRIICHRCHAVNEG